MSTRIEIAVATAGKEHQRIWGARFADGVRLTGDTVREIEAGAMSPCRFVACWGWRVAREYRRAGHDVLVAERGYVGDRFAWTSLGWNGLNGGADFVTDALAPKVLEVRWNQLWAGYIRPWTRRDGPAVMMGQVPGDQALSECSDYASWIRATASDLRALGWDVEYRPHPNAPDFNPIPEVRRHVGPLSECMARAAFTVTWNSNSATDSVLAGVPCAAMGAGAVAGPVAPPVLEPTRRDRTDWCRRLAWYQWTDAEMSDGRAWRHVVKRWRRDGAR